MEVAAGSPSHWIVTLAGGAHVDVWANAVAGTSEKTAHLEHITFDVLMDIDVELQGEFEVTARTVPPSRRVIVAVARFPRAGVQDISMA